MAPKLMQKNDHTTSMTSLATLSTSVGTASQVSLAPLPVTKAVRGPWPPPKRKDDPRWRPKKQQQVDISFELDESADDISGWAQCSIRAQGLLVGESQRKKQDMVSRAAKCIEKYGG